MGLISSKQRAAEADCPPIGAFVDLNGRNIHYFEKGSGPALVLIHGASGNLRDFNFGLMDKLAKTHRVIAIDRPGHGYSDRFNLSGESPALQAQLFVDTLEVLGVSEAIIGGYSMGGAIALAMALDHPKVTKGLLLMAAVTHPYEGGVGWLYASAGSHVTGPVLARVIAARMPQKMVMEKIQSVFEPQSPPEGYGDNIGAGLALRTHAIRANARQVVTFLPHIRAMSRRYHTLQMPIEILHGDQDKTVPAIHHAKTLSLLVPHARCKILKGIGHAPHHSAHNEVLAAVSRLQSQIS